MVVRKNIIVNSRSGQELKEQCVWGGGGDFIRLHKPGASTEQVWVPVSFHKYVRSVIVWKLYIFRGRIQSLIYTTDITGHYPDLHVDRQYIPPLVWLP